MDGIKGPDALSAARTAFRNGDPRVMAPPAGARWDHRAGELEIRCLGRRYRVDSSAQVVDERGRPAGYNVATLILQYLVSASGLPPRGRWLAFIELPEGVLHHVPFVEIVEKPLARHFAGRMEALALAARLLGGQPLAFRDCSFAVEALPRLPLAVVFRERDEEFPASANVLFDTVAPASLSTASLWVLGQELAGVIMETDAETIS